MAEKTYHIGRDGQPHECHAEKGKCPLKTGIDGQAQVHGSLKEVNKAIEEESKASTSGKSSLKKESEVIAQAAERIDQRRKAFEEDVKQNPSKYDSSEVDVEVNNLNALTEANKNFDSLPANSKNNPYDWSKLSSTGLQLSGFYQESLNEYYEADWIDNINGYDSDFDEYLEDQGLPDDETFNKIAKYERWDEEEIAEIKEQGCFTVADFGGDANEVYESGAFSPSGYWGVSVGVEPVTGTLAVWRDSNGDLKSKLLNASGGEYTCYGADYDPHCDAFQEGHAGYGDYLNSDDGNEHKEVPSTAKYFDVSIDPVIEDEHTDYGIGYNSYKFGWRY